MINHMILYISNHPRKKLVYFILDDSSPYFTSKEKNIIVKAGNSFLAKLHMYFIDENFISVLRESKADFIIWFAPFKHFESFEKITLPEVIIFSKKDLCEIQTIGYNINEMYSIEE